MDGASIPVTLFPLEEVTKIDLPEQLFNWLGFSCEVQGTTGGIDRILAYYQFSHAIKCGLTDCHTLHEKGYLVTTRDGRITNIGHNCGEKFFGIDFISKVRELEKHLALHSQKARLNEIIRNRDLLKAKIDAKLNLNSGWHHKSHDAFGRRYPEDLIRELTLRAIRDDGALYRERELTKEEIELRNPMVTEANSDSKPVYIRERIGEIKGLRIFRRDIRAVLGELDARLSELAFADKAALETKRGSLQGWTQWADRIPTVLQEADDLLKSGVEFFKQDNLDLCLHLASLCKNSKNFLKNKAWNYDHFHTYRRPEKNQSD
ncbi:MAG: hypothetical protein ACRD8U_20990 [Pyrinomonadaceae bacterium]